MLISHLQCEVRRLVFSPAVTRQLCCISYLATKLDLFGKRYKLQSRERRYRLNERWISQEIYIVISQT